MFWYHLTSRQYESEMAARRSGCAPHDSFLTQPGARHGKAWLEQADLGLPPVARLVLAVARACYRLVR